MSPLIRRLGPGDEELLRQLALDDAEFDLDGRGGPLQPLSVSEARQHLSNPAVLHWLALEGHAVIGLLYCLEIPLRSGVGRELLLYEIGVHKDWRLRGVGRALLDQMERWMRENGIEDVWVLADNPGAVEFYQSWGFKAEAEQPVYLTRTLPEA